MRILTSAILGIVLTVSTASAQSLSRTYTRPAVPPQEFLDRLNLKLAWRVFLPTDGYRDGFASIQILDTQILTQTRSGGIAMLDAGTGATLWRARVGVPYRGTQPLGVNGQSVFVLNGDHIYALSRATGQEQWDMLVPNAPSAAPVADESQLYLCLGSGRIFTYRLPNLVTGQDQPAIAPSPLPVQAQLEFRPPPGTLSTIGAENMVRRFQEQRHGPRAALVWSHPFTGGRLEQSPLITEEFLTLAATDGTFFTTSKHLNQVLYSFKTEAAVSAPLGQYGETAYIVSQDYNVYALNIVTGRILWRVLGGAPILLKPEVFAEDLYVAPERAGLYRLDRLTGQILWHNRQAERFLAQNKKFVYAADFSGRLVILDRVRGTLLTTYDGTRDYVFPIANELTDRIFLASNDGLLVCMHDRDYATPLRLRAAAEKKLEAKPADKPKEEDKPVEKPPVSEPVKPAAKPAKPEKPAAGEPAKPAKPEKPKDKEPVEKP